MLQKKHIENHFVFHRDWEEIFMLHFPSWHKNKNINPSTYTTLAWKIFESNGFSFTFERYSDNPNSSLYIGVREATLWKDNEEFITVGDLNANTALEQILIYAIERIDFNTFSRETDFLKKCKRVSETNTNFNL